MAQMPEPQQRTEVALLLSLEAGEQTGIFLGYTIMLFNCPVPAYRNLCHKSNIIVSDIQMTEPRAGHCTVLLCPFYQPIATSTFALITFFS